MLNDKQTSAVLENSSKEVDVQTCIEDCLSCHAVCLDTVSYCLEQGGKHVEAEHIRTLLDCAEICQTSANFMLRDSSFHAYTCDICAEICEECAEQCEQFTNDEQMQACTESCRRCAASCQDMVEEMSEEMSEEMAA
jgi:hypothetical protein